ncbi:exodeoxyribonuclease V subunit alpha [Neisseria sp. N95_16]|uniref:RecBCD enzyme subunit RecD n=1 Tax=Neisseria brasiliensis TaxID=2666100 RepID=A0A7X2GWI2_9NEIS|nr:MULTISPECIES: exodeoxyribonuclease V subunit alpha [Neisseria]MRN36982.1 exodeoxyribonuclease V subunit alpha [Neisseria brasiliensis]PJO10131.1 exodeoxyribonuclease V subunit alpha [Neisseria sp. N95_16]
MNAPIDLNQAAALAATQFLQHYAPEDAVVVTPYVEALFSALQSGHSFIWVSDKEAAALKRAVLVVGTDGETPLVLNGRRLFLGRLWQLEHDLAVEIKRLATASVDDVDWLQASQNLQNWFAEIGSEGQRDAAGLALLQAFMLITGGPGTGKTTTVAKLLGLICDNATSLPRIALAAPTGKAAAHMARALHRALDRFDLPERIKQHLLLLEGQTVHRLLKLRPPQMQSAFHAEQPLPLDVLVVDEASMLDLSLLLQLLKAIPSGCRVIFLGDEFQLPSVGVGAVLAALSRETVLDEDTHRRLSEYLPQHTFKVAEHPPALSQNIAHLQVSHRFGTDSGIGCLARAVVSGDSETAWAQFERFPDELQVLHADMKHQAEYLYHKHEKYWQAVESGNVALAFGHAADVVVLTAWRQDAENFNQAYFRHLQAKQRISGDMPWFAGQMIMITRNDYALDVFNGDIGLIMPDGESANGLAAYFPFADSFRKIPISRLPPYETAFAMTVHKSQGSEYREVWLLPPSIDMANESDDVLNSLNNALLYTGITRAQKRFVFWGNKKIFEWAVKIQKKRQTALDEMINTLF